MAIANWKEIVREVYGAIKSTSIRELARAGGVEPEDVAQEVLLKAVVVAQRGRPSGIHAVSGRDVRRFANTSARTTAIDHTRGVKRPFLLPPDHERWLTLASDDPSPEAMVLSREDRRLRAEAEARVQEIAALKGVVSGDSITAMAHQLGIHPSTMSRRVKKARQQLAFEARQPSLPLRYPSSGRQVTQ